MPLDSFAFAILNFGIATPSSVTVSFVDIGLNSASGYNVTEVFDNKYIGVFKSSQQLTVSVNPSGVFFAKAIAI
jgi:alpha-N-acetylgalactosaminidase